MPGYLLDAPTQIVCPHGGQATAKPGKTKVTLNGQPPFVLADFDVTQPTISGCPFTIPPGSPSPCLHIQWLMASLRVTVEQSPVLLSSSVGLCLNAGRIPQGTALVSGYQTRVEAQ